MCSHQEQENRAHVLRVCSQVVQRQYRCTVLDQGSGRSQETWVTLPPDLVVGLRMLLHRSVPVSLSPCSPVLAWSACSSRKHLTPISQFAMQILMVITYHLHGQFAFRHKGRTCNVKLIARHTAQDLVLSYHSILPFLLSLGYGSYHNVHTCASACFSCSINTARAPCLYGTRCIWACTRHLPALCTSCLQAHFMLPAVTKHAAPHHCKSPLLSQPTLSPRKSRTTLWKWADPIHGGAPARKVFHIGP